MRKMASCLAVVSLNVKEERFLGVVYLHLICGSPDVVISFLCPPDGVSGVHVQLFNFTRERGWSDFKFHP